jgi:hypothetical protein
MSLCAPTRASSLPSFQSLSDLVADLHYMISANRQSFKQVSVSRATLQSCVSKFADCVQMLKLQLKRIWIGLHQFLHS